MPLTNQKDSNLMCKVGLREALRGILRAEHDF